MKKMLLVLVLANGWVNIYTQLTVTGFVLTLNENQPVENAAVIFKVSNVVVFTDSTGHFSANIPNKEEFEVSHIAYSFSYKVFNEDVQNVREGKSYQWTVYLIPKISVFSDVVITANRAGNESPITFTNIKGDALNQNNFGEDMPFLLEATPSVVVTSDAGTGVGYTGMRIRGSDATRINVSINGVPYNDAESEQTYWVDLADIAESTDDIQVQRGVGTSGYGISSLGGAVNIYTNALKNTPFAKINASIGSFNLIKTTATIGTGTIANKWTLEGRFSKINSDGYIDRSFSDLNSYFFTAGYHDKKYSSYLNLFSSNEKTYQAWGGVPAELLETDPTYNPYTYENQTDNYTQTHLQWHHILQFNSQSSLQITLNYTKGNGYYEQLEEGQYFSDYGINPVIIATDTILQSDMITQKWLDNKYYGAYCQYKKYFNPSLLLTAGGAFYQYAGIHFGKVIWSEYASTTGTDFTWYSDTADKNEANIFAHIDYSKGKFNWMVDLQTRYVQYHFPGLDQEGNPLEQQVNLLFFNPKAGVTWLQNKNRNAYLFFGKSSKEPNRDDYVESSTQSRPIPETLYNVEIGERLRINGWEVMANYYWMYYTNQLVLTGQINDVGAYTRTNIPISYRTGIELAWSKLFFEKLTWKANTTLSSNKIINYKEYVDNWDDGSQTSFDYGNSAIAFSPKIIAYNELNYIFASIQNADNTTDYNFSIAFISKYVGQQFADNTSSSLRQINAYLLHDISLKWQLHSKCIPSLAVIGTVQNLLNRSYESNAWVYRYIYENTQQQMMGYYPQAGTNWVLSVRMEF